MFEKGQLATGLFFLVSGRVILSWGDAAAAEADALRAVNVVGGGDHFDDSWRERVHGELFGELALFPELAGRFRPDTAVAMEAGLAHRLPVRPQPIALYATQHIVLRIALSYRYFPACRFGTVFRRPHRCLELSSAR